MPDILGWPRSTESVVRSQVVGHAKHQILNCLPQELDTVETVEMLVTLVQKGFQIKSDRDPLASYPVVTSCN